MRQLRRDPYTVPGTRLNRETLKDIPSGTSGDVYSGYDLAGRPVWKRFAGTGGQGIDYGYNSAGRLTSETSFGRSLGFLYNKAGNRTRLTWPDGNYVAYSYDALQRMTVVRENGAASGDGVLASYQYDALSRRSSVSRGNGTSSGYAYDLASRLTSLSCDLGGTSSDATLTFGYTAAGQMSSRATSNAALGWWTAPEAVHAYAANGLNEYTSLNGTAFSHDADGNLSGDGARTLQYDVENRLISVSGSMSATLSYDPVGRLHQVVSGGATTEFLYEGDRLIAEYNGSTLLRRYVHGAGVDEPLVWYEGSAVNASTRRHLHGDERGSIIAWTDGSGSATVYSYGPYGEQPDWSGSRFRYTGQIALPEVQLYHYKARVYDPNIGRFLQTDPVGYGDVLNLYLYVHNDPMDRKDSNGLDDYNDYDPWISHFDPLAGFRDAVEGVAVGERVQAQRTAVAAARAGRYENRKIAERAVAATGAAAALVPGLAPVAVPVSIAATGIATVDKAVSIGRIETSDIAITAITLAPAGEAAVTLTGVKEVGEAVKSGQEILHAGAAALSLEAAIIERQQSHEATPSAVHETRQAHQCAPPTGSHIPSC